MYRWKFDRRQTDTIDQWGKKGLLTNDGEDVEPRGLIYTIRGNVNWCASVENIMEFLKILKIKL